jgi:glycosyltransferase involved in cell wall biosynthesis
MTRIAVALPCYNEAAAIPVVLAQWRQALPEAELWVFDNNSTDGTGELARKAGATVVAVPPQGKGHAMRAIFAALSGCDAVIVADGDGTYPAAAAASLLAPVLEGHADMTVGARRTDSGAGGMPRLRRLGNILIRATFRVLVGRSPGDLLSGYRVFSRHFLETISLHSSGFEIEAELACQAITRGMRVVEVPVPYLPRITGTASKLRAFRDGLRIVATIALLGLRLRLGQPGSDEARRGPV